MLDVCLLGTGGMQPLPRRWLTSLLLRFNGNSILIDCGEGTQIALKDAGMTTKPIEAIFLTHFHADHIAGLPGLLLTMGNSDRTEPVTIYGPRGVANIVRAVRTIAPELPFETRAVEIQGNEETFSVCGMDVTAFKVKHNILCYSYKVEVKRGGKFDVERAKANEIPLRFWNPLQKGQTIEDGGNVYTPDMVLGEARKGISLVYATDTRPTEDIIRHGRGTQLMILEGMYGEPDKLSNAKDHKHMMMQEAAAIARDAGTEEMWLTHYSPSLIHPQEYMDSVREIFPAAIAAKDGMMKTLNFDDEE